MWITEKRHDNDVGEGVCCFVRKLNIVTILLLSNFFVVVVVHSYEIKFKLNLVAVCT